MRPRFVNEHKTEMEEAVEKEYIAIFESWISFHKKTKVKKRYLNNKINKKEIK